MPERFGTLLRRLRRDSQKTLGDVADLLGVSVVFVSDVERGNRKPFNKDRIVRVATFLNVDPMNLMEAADHERGVIEYDISKAKPLEVDVVGGLVAGLARGGVSEEQLRKIKEVLDHEDDDE